MTIVTIILDCGHQRTWNNDADPKLYGKNEQANCRYCRIPELIASIITKAKAVAI